MCIFNIGSYEKYSLTSTTEPQQKLKVQKKYFLVLQSSQINMTLICLFLVVFKKRKLRFLLIKSISNVILKSVGRKLLIHK